MRPYLKLAGTSYRIDETYVKVGTQWKYLYRTLDKDGNTISVHARVLNAIFPRPNGYFL